MEDFLNGYVPGESHCPLTLLMNYRDKRSDVIDLIVSDESLSGIYDVSYINKVIKSTSNPSLVEDAYREIEKILLRVAKEYIELSIKRATGLDSELLDVTSALDCELDDYSGPDVIVKKIKANTVLQEYVPQAALNLGLDIDYSILNARLNFITKEEISELIGELSIMKRVINNLYSIIDNVEIIDERISEKNEKINSILTNMSSKTNNINSTDCKYTDFMSIIDKVRELHTTIRDSFNSLANLKKEDLYDVNGLGVEVILKIEQNNISKPDIDVMERALQFNYFEHKVYTELVDTIKTQLKEFNSIHADTDAVLKKVDL